MSVQKTSLLNAGDCRVFPYQADGSRIKECLNSRCFSLARAFLLQGLQHDRDGHEEPFPHGGRNNWDLLVWLKCLLYAVFTGRVGHLLGAVV